MLLIPVDVRARIPSMTSVPADTLTVPALPSDQVDESINPPFSTASVPAVVTSMVPARPAGFESERLALLMAATPFPWPSRVIDPADTLTVPALPDHQVDELILLPWSLMERLPFACTSMLPAFPDNSALLRIPVSPEPLESMTIDPALTMMFPARPLDQDDELIVAALLIESLPLARIRMSPASPLDPGLESLNRPEPVPSMVMFRADTEAAPPAPAA
ncbi:MAG: hypothetical protein AW09_004353 [Candidatus Accumulibacter phosphatis]|uniref:Uncharacterized protein n=1 Tax=Candidatus Accumulibacter phosphatis TaxID=327160 RepID=A0A080LSS3_9PROT|nr:MAG: hypothetical protein AW09_004353 [Candidatus Accumulibacter phosphatis]